MSQPPNGSVGFAPPAGQPPPGFQQPVYQQPAQPPSLSGYPQNANYGSDLPQGVQPFASSAPPLQTTIPAVAPLQTTIPSAPPLQTTLPSAVEEPPFDVPTPDNLNQQMLPFPTAPADAAPTVPSPPPAVAAEATPVDVLLSAFGKQPGCERYKGDAEKIKLLGLYFFVRQLTPNLTFELFLERFTPLADFDEANMKRPEDAIAALLPRSKSVATAKGVRQWSAAEVSKLLALYVDMARQAELTNTPLDPLRDVLQRQKFIDLFLSGAFEVPKEAAESKAAAQPKVAKTKPQGGQRPTAVNQRVLFTHASKRQYRGVVSNLIPIDPNNPDRQYIDFVADGGEEFKGCAIVNFTVIDDPLPIPAADGEQKPLAVLFEEVLTVRRADFQKATTTLNLEEPLGTVTPGEMIEHFTYAFPDGRVAVLQIVNAVPRPVLDAYLAEAETPTVAIAEIVPRRNLGGEYEFAAPNGLYRLKVKST